MDPHLGLGNVRRKVPRTRQAQGHEVSASRHGGQGVSASGVRGRVSGHHVEARVEEDSMTVREIVKTWLEEHGYDGLCSGGCGCRVKDLMPCGN